MNIRPIIKRSVFLLEELLRRFKADGCNDMYLPTKAENMEIALAIAKEHGKEAHVEVVARNELSGLNKAIKAQHPDAEGFIFLNNIDVVCLCIRELEKYLEKLEK